LGVLESEFDQLGIEIAKTYVKDRILLPLNPFAKVDKVGEIVVDIKQYLNK